MRPICFLSDFGLHDDFVGTCKGVMLGVAPGVGIIDLTHHIPGFAIEAGAEILDHATHYMPPDSVYLAVVDPGVGTDRREISLRTSSGALMVGPDNGLLIPAAMSLGGIEKAVLLQNEKYHISPVSNTFHGRDVFSPVAAHLASGVDISDLGSPLEVGTLQRLDAPEDEPQDGDIVAKVIDVDRFGNARLSVRETSAALDYGDELKLDVGDGDMSIRYVRTFGAAAPGELILVVDSHWRLSVAINKGNAAQALALSLGNPVRLKKTQP